MKKIQVRRNLRLGIMLICIALIVVLAVLSFIRYKYPGVEEKKVLTYSYESKDKVNYEVFLKPNSLYATKSLGEDQVYFANLIDYVDTAFTYEFTGEREAEIKGSYDIYAVVEGYTGEGDKLTTLWKKQFPLVAKTNFEANDKKYAITKKIPWRLSDYNAFAEKIKEETKISTQAKVSTYMNVELSAKTDKGVIEKKSTTSLEVPLASNYFKITKKQGEGKPEAIVETKSVPRPLNKNLLMGCGVGIGVLFIALLFLIFGTQKAVIDPFVKELKKIFKKHGTRLVALESELAATSEQQNKVHSIEDLVRVSDELGRPIIYKHCQNYKENSKFWVIDGNRYYVLDLREIIGYGNSLKEKVKIPIARNRTEGDSQSMDKDITNMNEKVVTPLDSITNREEVPSMQPLAKNLQVQNVVTWEKI